MNQVNIDRMMGTLSKILSEKYGAKITVQAIPKKQKERASA